MCQSLYPICFSERAAASRGKPVRFSDTKCWIYNKTGNVCGMGSLVDKLYQLDCKPVSLEHVSVAAEQNHDIDLWYQRLGHLGKQCLQEIESKKLMNGIDISKSTRLSFCEGCVEEKMHRNLFNSVREIYSPEKLQLIYVQ